MKQLENYISQVPFFDFKGGCRCATEAMKYIREDIVDAIFLDINMPDINGIDFVKTLVTPPIIVFTTASEAVQSGRVPPRCRKGAGAV